MYHDFTAGAKRDKNQRKRMMKINGKGVRLMMLAHYPLSSLNTSLSSVRGWRQKSPLDEGLSTENSHIHDLPTTDLVKLSKPNLLHVM